nr:MAG TPA: hypothetical protein [Bacteriophage sp.]
MHPLRLASLSELQSVYSLEDAWNFLEIMLVDRVNRRSVHRWQEKKNGNRY